MKADDPPAVQVYVSRCGRRPTSQQHGELVHVVGEDRRRLRAWVAVCETWAATHEPGSGKEPYNLANVRRMLKNLAEDLQAQQGANLAAIPEAQRAAKRLAEARERRERERREGAQKPADPDLVRRLAEETFGERYTKLPEPQGDLRSEKRRRGPVDVDAVEAAIAGLSDTERAEIEAEAERRGREALGEVFDVSNPSVASALLRLRREVYLERHDSTHEEVAQ